MTVPWGRKPMFPDPGQQAAMQAQQDSRRAAESARQAQQDGLRAAQMGARHGIVSRRSHSGSGRGGGLLSFLLLVAAVVLVARDHELRAPVLTLMHHIVN